MAALQEIGTAVRLRRIEMGLTQEALARVSGLSRSTINAVEKKSIGNLSIAKAEELLEAIGLSMSVGATPPRSSTHAKVPASRSALERAAATASVSYAPALNAKQLKGALVSGEAPEEIWPQMRALLDEAPMSLLAKVVEELHLERGMDRSQIWGQMRRLARQLKCFRLIWQSVGQ